MRADRPLIAAAAFLAAGLTILFVYGTAHSGLSAALPFSNSSFHLDLTTNGPAAIGGVVLTVIGILLLIWAIFAAIVWHGSLLSGEGRARERIVEHYPESATETTTRYVAPASTTTERKHFL